MAVNTLHWHDASKELPLALTDEENEALIIACGEDDNNLTWHQATRKGNRWIGDNYIEIDGKEYHFEALFKNVKYWAEFPKCDFTR